MMPKVSEPSGFRKEQERLKQANFQSTQQMTLVQRTNAAKPLIPSLVSPRPVPVESEPAFDDVRPILPEPPHTMKQMSMNDFVGEKRQIFLEQLMIERKRSEIHRLESQIVAQEKDIQDTDSALDDTSNQYKMTRSQAEAALARAQRASELAMKKRTGLQKELKLEEQSVTKVRSEISKNRERLDSYRSYQEFMNRVVPKGLDPDEFFTSPRVLADEMDSQEERTLFFMKQFQSLEREFEKRLGRVTSRIDSADDDFRLAEAKVTGLPVIDEFTQKLTPSDVKYAASIEGELWHLNYLIEHAYANCFGSEQCFGSLLMLERIEKALEDLYRLIGSINPAFVQAKQLKKDEKRMEKQRLEIEARKEAEQKLKYDQAVERAQMPIKKRTGRPPVKRMLPIKTHRPDPEQSQAEAIERERLESLLYGADSD
jgi:hypothetical protein